MGYKNVLKLTSRADKTQRGGRGKPSISVVCTEKNGKRLTLSSSLLEQLEITDVVYIGALESERQIIISGNPNPNFEEFSLSSRYIYNAALVSGIVNVFGLSDYFQSHASISFSDVTFDGDTAIVTIPSLNDEITEALSLDEDDDENMGEYEDDNDDEYDDDDDE